MVESPSEDNPKFVGFRKESTTGNVPALGRVVVMCHGVGTNLHVYDTMTGMLTKEGMTVIRYEYFNHGFSKGEMEGGHHVKICKTVLLNQLEDVLDHVLKNRNEMIHGLVGHSTGGALGALAGKAFTSESSQHRIRNLGLISPCLWAPKPLIAMVAETFPNFFFGVSKTGILNFSIKDAYMENCRIAFAKKDKKTYVFPEAYKEAVDLLGMEFKHHPYIRSGIFAISTFFITSTGCKEFRKAFDEVAKNSYTRITCSWGDHDMCVPYKSKFIKSTFEGHKPEKCKLDSIPNQGHESLSEDTVPIAAGIVKLFDEISPLYCEGV